MSQLGDIADPVRRRGADPAEPVLRAQRRRSCRRSRRAWTSCARPATPAARASRSSPAACPWAWAQPLFDKLDADIAYAMMGINAVKGVEIGAGFASVAQRGSEHGDELTPQGFVGNNAGGVLGGISTGQDLRVSIAIKPTSSIRIAAPLDRPRRRAGRRRDLRPPRPLRGHPRHAHRRGDAGAGGDGPRAGAPRPVRRRRADMPPIAGAARALTPLTSGVASAPPRTAAGRVLRGAAPQTAQSRPPQFVAGPFVQAHCNSSRPSSTSSQSAPMPAPADPHSVANSG